MTSDLGPKESAFYKHERMSIRQEYLKQHPMAMKKFKCACGKYHSWAELGRKH